MRRLSILLLFLATAHPALAVLGVPIANMQHAEKYEKLGRFARAAEERELAAEFYHWISVPQYKEYLAYYQARGDLGQIADSEEWLRNFDEWIAICRQKAEEDWGKVDPTPAQREKSRRRVEKRVIASANLYPMMHQDMLNIDLGALERKARYPEQFEGLAEARERTARLYEAMGVRYAEHAAEEWEALGKSDDVARMRAEVERFQKLIEHNRSLAAEAREQAKKTERWGDEEYLKQQTIEAKPEQMKAVLDRFAFLGRTDQLRRALMPANTRFAPTRYPDPTVQQHALKLLEQHWDLLGILWAAAEAPAIAKEAQAILDAHPISVQSERLPALLGGLRGPEEAIRAFAEASLKRILGADTPENALMLPQWLDAHTDPGLIGTYYAGKMFEKEQKWVVDSSLAFEWDAPPHGIPSNVFSARWVGWLKVPQTGSVDLWIENDDGARLWLDGQRLIDDWHNHARRMHGKHLTLDAGYHPIRIDYYNDKNQGVMRLLWKVDGKTEPIPSEMLRHVLPPER